MKTWQPKMRPTKIIQNRRGVQVSRKCWTLLVALLQDPMSPSSQYTIAPSGAPSPRALKMKGLALWLPDNPHLLLYRPGSQLSHQTTLVYMKAVRQIQPDQPSVKEFNLLICIQCLSPMFPPRKKMRQATPAPNTLKNTGNQNRLITKPLRAPSFYASLTTLRPAVVALSGEIAMRFIFIY